MTTHKESRCQCEEFNADIMTTENCPIHQVSTAKESGWREEFDRLYGVYLARVDQNHWGMSIDESARKFIAQVEATAIDATEARVLSEVAKAIEENTAFYEKKYGGNYEQCGRDIKFSLAEVLFSSKP